MIRKLFVLALAVFIAVIFAAPSEAGVPAVYRVTFVIGLSNYTVDGLEKNMDAAAFLENGRTYVPVRFLGNSLGMADSDIGWDGASLTPHWALMKGTRCLSANIHLVSQAAQEAHGSGPTGGMPGA